MPGALDIQRHCGRRNGQAFKIGTIHTLVQQQCRTIALRTCRLNPIHPIRDLDLGLLGGRIRNLKLVLHSVFTIRKQPNLGNPIGHRHSKKDLLKPIANGHAPVRLNPRNLPTHTCQPNRGRLFHRKSLQLAKGFQGGGQVAQNLFGQLVGSRRSPVGSLGHPNLAVFGSRNFRGVKPDNFLGV